MPANVWYQANHYCGCDEKFFPKDDRLMFVADNKRVLRAIDLSRFNIFDLDGYGVPWAQAQIIAARRKVTPGEKIGLVLTEGGHGFYKYNGVPTVNRGLLPSWPKVGLSFAETDMIDHMLATLTKRWGVKVVKRFEAHSGAVSKVHYMALQLAGV